MAMGLACACDRPAIEKPESLDLIVHSTHRRPVVQVQPAQLWRPLPGDEKQMANLNWIFVQDETVIGVNRSHLQAWIPWKEGVGFWPWGEATVHHCRDSPAASAFDGPVEEHIAVS